MKAGLTPVEQGGQSSALSFEAVFSMSTALEKSQEMGLRRMLDINPAQEERGTSGRREGIEGVMGRASGPGPCSSCKFSYTSPGRAFTTLWFLAQLLFARETWMNRKYLAIMRSLGKRFVIDREMNKLPTFTAPRNLQRLLQSSNFSVFDKIILP